MNATSPSRNTVETNTSTPHQLSLCIVLPYMPIFLSDSIVDFLNDLLNLVNRLADQFGDVGLVVALGKARD